MPTRPTLTSTNLVVATCTTTPILWMPSVWCVPLSTHCPPIITITNPWAEVPTLTRAAVRVAPIALTTRLELIPSMQQPRTMRPQVDWTARTETTQVEAVVRVRVQAMDLARPMEQVTLTRYITHCTETDCSQQQLQPRSPIRLQLAAIRPTCLEYVNKKKFLHYVNFI